MATTPTDEDAPITAPTLAEYIRDPRRIDAEIAEHRAMANAAIDAGMRRLNDRQAAEWAQEDAA